MGSSPPKFAGGPRKGGRSVSARTRAAGRLARVALANGAIIGRASALQPPRCLGAARHGQPTGVLRTPIAATLLINSVVWIETLWSIAVAQCKNQSPFCVLTVFTV
jgi:hypothetical protein